MNSPTRPLASLTLGISISESDTSRALGYPKWQVTRTILKAVAALYGQGVTLAFGHDWRDDGVMAAVYGFAQQIQSPSFDKAEAVPQEQALLLNLLTWDEEPFLNSDQLAHLAPTLVIEQLPKPTLPHSFGPFANRIGNDVVRAFALRELRVQLDERIDARLCIGGRLVGYQGFLPGILEEASQAIRSRKPLYLCGFLEGATCSIIRSVIQHAEFQKMTNLDLTHKPQTVKEYVQAYVEEAYRLLSILNEKTLSELNKLTVEENRELFETASLDRAMELVLKGLSSVARSR